DSTPTATAAMPTVRDARLRNWAVVNDKGISLSSQSYDVTARYIRICRQASPNRAADGAFAYSLLSAGRTDRLARQPSQRRRRIGGHDRMLRRNRRERLVGLALRRPLVVLALVGPQRRRPFSLGGDRKRRIHTEIRRNRRAVHHGQRRIAVHPLVG